MFVERSGGINYNRDRSCYYNGGGGYRYSGVELKLRNIYSVPRSIDGGVGAVNDDTPILNRHHASILTLTRGSGGSVSYGNGIRLRL